MAVDFGVPVEEDLQIHGRTGWKSLLPIPGNPLVSMVISAYRRPRSILSCVHSLLVQTHQNLEVIVVHDGPGPEVKAALDGIKDDRVRFFELIPRAGHFGNDAREYGIKEHARGAWVGTTNDDNYFMPTFLEALLSAAIARGAEFAYCNAIHSFYGWGPLIASIKVNHIDVGGWICRANVAKSTLWPSKDKPNSDGEYVVALARGREVVKVPGFLFVHN